MAQFIHTLGNSLFAISFALADQTAVAAASMEAVADPDPAIVAFLLDASAKDFKLTGGNLSMAIKDARIGQFTENGKTINLLCGTFKPVADAEDAWVHFATVKTSDYEQWLGATAKAFCDQESMQWYPQDYTAELLHKLSE